MQVDATYLLQLTMNGLMLGLIYALIAVGLALVFGVLEIINFAHGELLMVGAYVMAFALPALGGHYIPAMLIALLASALLGLVLYQGFLARLRDKDFERSILVTMGISMVLLYGCQYLFSATPKMVNTEFGFAGVAMGSIKITWTRVIAAGLAVVAFAFLWFILFRTQFGRAMRAVSINREAALMVGVRPQSVARNAVIIATILCGLAGAALAPIHLVQPIMGQFLIFKAFALIIIGGLGSMSGAIFAGIALGILESWIGGFFDIIWQEVAGFIVMMAVLLLRPQGLFGQAAVRTG
jgi:branched-chain amino acid transport system permease protein